MTPNRLSDWISPAQAERIRAPIGQACTLPRQAFTSEAFFALEVERIFSRHWTALCFAQQAPQPGCLLPLEFAGVPLLLVHGDDGRLRVFHNIVPYDGCLAVIDAVHTDETIDTPYHGWRYDLRGKLVAVPYWDGTPHGNLAALEGRPGDLVEVRCHTELGVVFMDLGGGAGEVGDGLQALRTALADYSTDGLEVGLDELGGPLFDGEVLATNWKTHYENWALNVLHEGFTHEVYAESSQIPRVDANGKKTYQELVDGRLMALSYREQDFAETYGLEELPFATLGRQGDVPERSFIGSFFPNLHLAVFPYFIHMIIVHPVSAGWTHTLRAQLYAADSARDPALLDERLMLQGDFRQAGEEDGRITEAVQKARRSPVYGQQFYSPFWDRMHYLFSCQVLDALENNTDEGYAAE